MESHAHGLVSCRGWDGGAGGWEGGGGWAGAVKKFSVCPLRAGLGSQCRQRWEATGTCKRRRCWSECSLSPPLLPRPRPTLVVLPGWVLAAGLCCSNRTQSLSLPPNPRHLTGSKFLQHSRIFHTWASLGRVSLRHWFFWKRPSPRLLPRCPVLPPLRGGRLLLSIVFSRRPEISWV